MSLSQSLDLPDLDRVDTLAQELALLQDKGMRRIAMLGSRHVPVVAIHLVELMARSLAQEGHSLITSGAQGVNAANPWGIGGRFLLSDGFASPEPGSTGT